MKIIERIKRLAQCRTWCAGRRLLDFLFPPRVDELALRDMSDDGFFSLTSPRLVAETEPAAVALLPFSAPAVRAAIHEAKYHGSERPLILLSSILADYLRDQDDAVLGGGTRVLVPVPLGKARHKERGFNQVEEVVKRTARQAGITMETGALLRTRETLSQVSLSREKRRENMRGAFSAAHPLNPASTYIVIDDVITTGATLQAASDALRKAGAKTVIPLALAH